MSGREAEHLSIGEVLAELSDEFPDITISKIRFLESQGLVNPERTPSGYRKFYASDLTRLRWILYQQKEHFLPLKVIKERLDELPPGGEDGLFETVEAATGDGVEEVAVDVPAEVAETAAPAATPASAAGGSPSRPAPRPPRQSFLLGPSTVGWVAVVACTVVIKPSVKPKLSLITFAIGARQLVVQEALLTTLSLDGSNLL